MSEFFKTILVMSISGGIITILLFALKPLVKNRLPKSAQYYLWLVVIAALLIPVSKLIALPIGLNPIYGTKAMVETTVQISPSDALGAAYRAIGDAANGGLGTIPVQVGTLPGGLKNMTELFHSQVWVAFGSYAWGFGFAAVLIYYIISYSVFTRLRRRRNIEAKPNESAMLFAMCGKKRIPKLYRNKLVATPMLIGVFRPAIILPGCEYTHAQLHSVLLHELTHLQRKDILVKWLLVVACAAHWFNPIVWLARREIDRICELSCDEAVIRNLDTDGRRNYGDTLLYVAADSKTSRAVLSTTMCEEKKALKERLGAIMKSKKQTRLAIVMSIVLILAFSGTAIALGAGSSENNESTTNRDLQYIGFNGFSLGSAVSGKQTATLTPTDRYTNGEYDYNFEEARFSVDMETRTICKLWLNVYETGAVCSLDDTTSISPWTTISQIRGYFGEGKQGWQDRGQRLRYVEHRQTQGGLTAKVRFVYADDEYNRLVWIIAESNLPASSPVNGMGQEYEKHGISWDSESRMLFDGKLVRYFWDGFNVDANSFATHYDYLNEDGVVDIYTVRDIVYVGGGGIDLFGELLDIVAYSQQEFDARDIEDLRNPPRVAAASSESGGMPAPSASGQMIPQAAASSERLTPDELARLYAA